MFRCYIALLFTALAANGIFEFAGFLRGDSTDLGGVLLIASLLAGAMAVLVGVFADRLGAWLQVVDVPDGTRKLHARATPQVGGFAVVPPVVLTALWYAATTSYLPLFTSLAIITLAFLGLGYIDDRSHIKPSVRLTLGAAICYAAVAVVPAYGVDFLKFTFLSHTLFLGGWTVVFSLLCLVGLQNAVNMADGKNGLVPGLALIWTLLIAAYAPVHLLPVLAALAVALCVVLAFNLAGRLFLGDSGCYAITILVGLLAIHTHYVGFARLPADVIALWFLVPVLDCLRLMVSRVLVGQSPFEADRRHLHHYLNLLAPWRFGLPAYFALVAVPGVLAYAAPAYTGAWAMLALTCYLALLGLGMREERARGLLQTGLRT